MFTDDPVLADWVTDWHSIGWRGWSHYGTGTRQTINMCGSRFCLFPLGQMLSGLKLAHSGSHLYHPLLQGSTKWGKFPLWLSTIFACSLWPGAETMLLKELSNSSAFCHMLWRQRAGIVIASATELTSTDSWQTFAVGNWTVGWGLCTDRLGVTDWQLVEADACRLGWIT